MPYTDEMLSTVFARPLNTVRLALQTFEQFGMIEKHESISICNWQKHQNEAALSIIREQERERKKLQRQKAKLIDESKCPGNVPDSHATDIDIELDKELDKRNIYKHKHKHGEYKNVLLTDEEYTTLKDDYGESQTESAIRYFSEAKEMKGYKYKSDYLAMRKWAFKAVPKDDDRSWLQEETK
jgi:hypothetical protein